MLEQLTAPVSSSLHSASETDLQSASCTAWLTSLLKRLQASQETSATEAEEKGPMEY